MIKIFEDIKDIAGIGKAIDVNQARELKKFQVLYDLAVAVSAEQTLDDNLQLVVEKSRDLFDCDAAFIALRDKSDREVYMHCLSGINTEAFKNLRIQLGIGVGGLVAATQRGSIIHDYFNDATISHEVDNIIAAEGIISCLAAPINIGNKNLGVLYVANRRRTIYTQADLDTLSLIGNLAAVEMSRKRFEEDLKQRNLELAKVNSMAANLSHKLIQAQEDERRHLARELHDDFGQILTVVKISLQSLLQEYGSCDRLRQVIEHVEIALQGIRRLSFSLRPSVLDDLGLEAALRWHMDNQAQLTGLTTRLNSNLAGRRLRPDMEICCFRIIQEALTNVIRHAHAQSVLVEIQYQNNELCVLIHDDGAGFDVDSALEEAVRGRSLGLLGLKERVALVGGDIKISSSINGGGTTIQIIFKPFSFDESGVSDTEVYVRGRHSGSRR